MKHKYRLQFQTLCKGYVTMGRVLERVIYSRLTGLPCICVGRT